MRLARLKMGCRFVKIPFLRVRRIAATVASVGSVGDACDNAMAESFLDSFKTELIADRSWRKRSQLELAVVEYVAWLNNERLHKALGDRTPREIEETLRCEREGNHTHQMKDGNQSKRSPRNPARLIPWPRSGWEPDPRV
jgi:integrase-like protein